MSDLMFLIKSQGAILLPFVNSVFLYFVFVQDPKGELWTTILKCVPIVFLMMYILLKGINLTNEYKKSQRILLGLIFSCCGDALLNVDLFPHGMGAFAIAQICYISAFGWRPLKWPIGLGMYICGAGPLVFKNLDFVLKFGLPVYAVLLITMSWRAIACGVNQKNFLCVFCAFGSILFVISDALICINMFYIPVPYARVWIMITYYVAQFAIALSSAKESKYSKKSKQSSKESLNGRIQRSMQARKTVKSRD